MAWWAIKEPGRYQIGYREPGGKKRFKTFKTFDAARRFKSETEAQVDRGTYTPLEARKTPLGAYMDLVLGAGNLSDSTQGAYHYRRTHTRRLEAKPIGDITTADIRELMGRLELAAVGPPTRASVRKLLSKVFAAAVRDGILVRNPVSPVPAPKSERREIHVYTPMEIKALADSIRPELKGAVYLSAYGGLRGGEVAGLREQDIGWLSTPATVSITQAVRLVRGRAVLGAPKTKASIRTVSVPRFVLDELVTNGGGLLFPKQSSKTLGAAFRVALTKTGLQGRWHDLRHTSVALAIEQGAHPKEIQTRLGHSSYQTTFDVYGAMFPGLDGELANRMDAAYGDTEPGAVAQMNQRSERE
jgi:integrase